MGRKGQEGAGESRRELQCLHPEILLSYDKPFSDQQCLVL